LRRVAIDSGSTPSGCTGSATAAAAYVVVDVLFSRASALFFVVVVVVVVRCDYSEIKQTKTNQQSTITHMAQIDLLFRRHRRRRIRSHGCRQTIYEQTTTTSQYQQHT
jgi:hypothetical protein